MGLFSRKKAPDPVKKIQPSVNADDIFNTPSPRKNESVSLREGGQPLKTEKVEVQSISPEDIAVKMQELESEIAQKQAEPKQDYSKYNLVADDEIEKAEEEYEEIYKRQHEEYIRTHQQDITEANTSDLDSMVSSMMSEVNAHRAEEAAKDYEFSQVDGDTVAQELSKLADPKNVELDAAYKDIDEVTSAQLEKASNVIINDFDKRVVAKPVDDIESI